MCSFSIALIEINYSRWQPSILKISKEKKNARRTDLCRNMSYLKHIAKTVIDKVKEVAEGTTNSEIKLFFFVKDR